MSSVDRFLGLIVQILRSLEGKQAQMMREPGLPPRPIVQPILTRPPPFRPPTPSMPPVLTPPILPPGPPLPPRTRIEAILSDLDLEVPPRMPSPTKRVTRRRFLR